MRFDDSYHVVFTNSKLLDDVSQSFSFRLKHAWFDSRLGDVQLREVAKYQPIDDIHALPDLVLYRNKLLSTWKVVNGRILSARWDNADPALPWITYGRTGSGLGRHRPAIVSFNRRPFVSSGEMGSPQYGDDAYAIISGTRQNGKPEFIVISRALMRKDLAREVTLYNSRSDTLDPVCRGTSEPFGPEKITNLWSEERVVLSEIGFNLWVFPKWMIHSLYSDFTTWMCTSTDGQWQDGHTPCQTSRLPVYIKDTGGMFNCGGAWINRDKSYIGVWEEMGHYFTPALGFGTSIIPTQASADFTGISLPILTAGRQLFSEETGSCTGMPSPRCTGFTGYGGNYDNGGVEHSFMYTIFYYLTKGDELRQFIVADLATGSDLLQRKYNWIKENIFRGIEYRNNLEPI